MILEILLHPVVLAFTLIFAFLLFRSLWKQGTHLFDVYDCIYAHIDQMIKQDADAVWSKFSIDLKFKLGDRRRSRKNLNMQGINRLRSFMGLYSNIYVKEHLAIDTVHQVKIRPPKEMYQVKLRSQKSGYIRLTVWVSRVPFRMDGWSIDDICVHPADGDDTKGETLTGKKIKSPKVVKLIQDRKKKMEEARRLREFEAKKKENESKNTPKK
jgi:hypothetical protein